MYDIANLTQSDMPGLLLDLAGKMETWQAQTRPLQAWTPPPPYTCEPGFLPPPMPPAPVMPPGMMMVPAGLLGQHPELEGAPCPDGYMTPPGWAFVLQAQG